MGRLVSVGKGKKRQFGSVLEAGRPWKSLWAVGKPRENPRGMMCGEKEWRT